MNLFYFTASNKIAQKHLEDTIENKSPIGRYSDLLDEDVLQELKRAGQAEEVNMWGAVPGDQNIPRWAKMEKGDKVLVYSKGTFLYYGTILTKTHNRKLAEIVWDKDNDGKTWEYIYFITDLQSINLDRTEFASFFGYKQNFVPQGFNRINSNTLDEIINNYGSINDAISFLTNSKLKDTLIRFKGELETKGERELENSVLDMTDEQFSSYLQSLDQEASVEVKEGLKKVRKYNKKIIDELKEKYNHCCQICGHSGLDDYGVSVVEAHHIQEFALTQNNSPENIMILCPNHHRLIHKAKGKFDRKKKEVCYSNGYVESITINYHL